MDLKLSTDFAHLIVIGSSFHSRGAAAENDLSPYDVDVFTGSNKNLVPDLSERVGLYSVSNSEM